MTYIDAINRLVQAGATMELRSGIPVAVAYWSAISPTRHFWMEPGDTHHDGHRFDCARTEVLYGGEAVAFRASDGALIAYLTAIDEATDDEGLRARLRTSIEFWRKQWEADARLRAFVLREAKEAASG